MIILLLTILAIALLFIFAGLLLSPRSSEPTQRGISYAARSGTGMRTPARSSTRRIGPTMARSQQVAGIRRASRSYTQDFQRSPWENFMETVNIERLFRPRVGDKAPWLGLTLILVALFIVSLLLLKSLLPDSMVIGATWPDVAVSASPPTSSTVAKNSSPDNPFASLSGASGELMRLPQLDSSQYNSQQDPLLHRIDDRRHQFLWA